VVARVESLIAGWELDEALRRAEAYYSAGADAILMHSKLKTADQILDFMRAWENKCPVVIVPTTYYNTPTSAYEEAGVSLVIWANHLLRASIKAMQQTAAQIYQERSLSTVEGQVVTVKEIFRLQNAGELEEAEQRYLPKAERV
jgi:phosphoenolpyruvate phosphomutase